MILLQSHTFANVLNHFLCGPLSPTKVTNMPCHEKIIAFKQAMPAAEVIKDIGSTSTYLE